MAHGDGATAAVSRSGDAARAIQFLIDRDLFDGRIFNVVTETATVREVLGLIREVAPEAAVEQVESAVMTSRSQTVSCARLRREGFSVSRRSARGHPADDVHAGGRAELAAPMTNAGAVPCRICGAGVMPFMSFGRMPIANGFLNEAELASEYFYELAPRILRRLRDLSAGRAA